MWTAVVKLFGYPLKTATLVGTGLTQIGEFSFILVQVAHSSGLVGDEFYSATLAVSLLSILINAWMVKSVPTWLQAPKPARRALVISRVLPRLPGLEVAPPSFYNCTHSGASPALAFIPSRNGTASRLLQARCNMLRFAQDGYKI